MPNFIPVITPTDAEILVRYFSGVDAILARRFTLGFLPDEEHLTSLLCELLDDRGAGLHQLPYTVTQLNEDLKQNNSLLNVDLKLETIQYNKYQERNITQSDLGIIINYIDTIRRNNSFRKGILLQAKKLFPNNNNVYTLESQYKSFNLSQHDRLYSLAESISKLRDPDNGVNYNCAAYLFYNPPLQELPDRDRQIVLHDQISGTQYLYEEDIRLGRKYKTMLLFSPYLYNTSFFLNTSSFIVPIDDMHRIIDQSVRTKPTKSPSINLKVILEYTQLYYNAFACFMVFGLLLGRAGCQNPNWLRVVSGAQPNAVNDNILLQPRYVLTINITAGTIQG